MTENIQGDGILEGMKDVIQFPGVWMGPDTSKTPTDLPDINALLALLIKQKDLIDLVYQLAIIKVKIALLLMDMQGGEPEKSVNPEGQAWPPK